MYMYICMYVCMYVYIYIYVMYFLFFWHACHALRRPSRRGGRGEKWERAASLCQSCISLYIYIYTYIHILIYTHSLSLSMCIYIYIYTHVYTYICIHIQQVRAHDDRAIGSSVNDSYVSPYALSSYNNNDNTNNNKS